MSAAAFFTIVMMLWAVVTTVYGLYLSKQNNERYNQKIVEHLEAIRSHLCGTEVVDLFQLTENGKAKKKFKGFEMTIKNPFKGLMGGNKNGNNKL